MSEKVTFLLVSKTSRNYWRQVLGEALSSLGSLQVHQEQNVLALVLQQSFALIIIDAAAVSDAARLVSRIRICQPDARIVVATASPTWKQAREVFYAGAVDYVRKLSDKNETLFMLKNALEKALPANGREERSLR